MRIIYKSYNQNVPWEMVEVDLESIEDNVGLDVFFVTGVEVIVGLEVPCDVILIVLSVTSIFGT